MSGTLSYVYAVGRQDAPLDGVTEEVLGQDGSRLRCVPAAGLRALVGSVPGERFDEAGLHAQLEDMERLEVVARCHHAVVEAAFRHAVVLPMRLATLCHDDDRVADMLRDRAADFDDRLGRLEGRSEWGVKVYVDASAAAEASRPQTVPAAPGGAEATAAPGRDYLRRRRTQRDSTRQVYRSAESVLARIAEHGDRLAAAGVAHRPQQGELATGPGENVANHAYLVDTGRGDDFAAAMSGAAAGAAGVRVEVTGPWAPYSFTAPDDA